MSKKNSSATPAGASKSEPPSKALQVVAPGTLSLVPSGPLVPSDAQLGKQLTAQYKLAVSGMREVLIFGAMLMQVENSLSNVDTLSVRGLPKTGHGVKGQGLKGWLEANAPEISRATAYRFLGITKAIAAEYQTIVGAKVAKQFAITDLVLAAPDKLTKDLQLKQGELFDYVAGTSQRSWLDRYAEKDTADKRKAPAGREVRNLDEEIEFQRMLSQDKFQLLIVEMEEFFLSKRDKRFGLLGDADRALMLGLLVDINKANRK